MDGETTPRPQPTAASRDHDGRFARRAMLMAGGAALGAASAASLGWPILREHLRSRAAVFVARNQKYDGQLAQTIRDGLRACGIRAEQVRGQRVLLKPNMVEPIRTSPQMTTHPAMVVATAEVFLGWGAKVVVGEGPGHVRDTELALAESGLGPALDEARLEFADLNYQEVAAVKNAGQASPLTELYFPQAVHEADLIVSMPKLKTHHWMGFTAAMKNLYGVMPGLKYGWPKNVLHHAGIPESAMDINATLRRTVAVVDAITCMEGDGPIMGSAKEMGLVLVGNNLPALDATCARIMGLLPEKVHLLWLAGHHGLGPLDDRQISQRGERWQELVSPFSILDYPHLQQLRSEQPAGVQTSRHAPAGRPAICPRAARAVV